MLKELGTRKISVKDLKGMLEKGELGVDTSVQRNFVYNTPEAGKIWIKDRNGSSRQVKRSTAVVETILQGGMLPEIILFRNSDTGRLTLHDGKQRVSSAVGYLNGGIEDANGQVNSGNWLDPDAMALWDKVADFEFRAVTYEGTAEDEEATFEAINTRSLPLTQYETLKALYHGEWLSGYEAYLNSLSGSSMIKKVGRGEQAYMLLLMLGDIVSFDQKQMALDDVDRYEQLKKTLAEIGRDREFAPGIYHFDEKLEFWQKLCSMHGTSVSSSVFKPWTACQLTDYLFDNCSAQERETLMSVFGKKASLPNDIGDWRAQHYRTFIKETLNGKDLDGRRGFTTEERHRLLSEAEKASPDGIARCADCGCELNLKNSTVDHIIPWAEGGRTDLSNARLLCSPCNSRKGRKTQED